MQHVFEHKGEADAIKLRGEALRENTNVVQLDAIAKWNGILPTYMAGTGQTPFVTVPVGK